MPDNFWKRIDCVCFDIDSTVCQDEGLDELAKFMGLGEQVKALTNSAMSGKVTFRESFAQRLDILKPSVHKIEEFLVQHPPILTPGVKEFVTELQKNGLSVYLITGGLFQIVKPVADLLNIPTDNVFANRLVFADNGEYSDFDKSQPTSHQTGKGDVIKLLKAPPYNHDGVVMIGDGATDLQAAPFSDLFIGFGGNVCRTEVKEKSKYFYYSMRDIQNLFEENGVIKC